MKNFLIGLLMAIIIIPTPALAEEDSVDVPEEIYKWVQSTSRGNYYFNYQIMGYKINSDDTLDLNTLIVPTICTYDYIQAQDVIQKRRWHMQSVKGYDILAGRADYLSFNLKNNTVTITERVDLDNTFTALDTVRSDEPIYLSELSSQDISCKFYREILKWAKENNDWIIKRSRGHLSTSDRKLKPEDMPINKIELPGK